jgi:hypothetical protein
MRPELNTGTVKRDLHNCAGAGGRDRRAAAAEASAAAAVAAAGRGPSRREAATGTARHAAARPPTRRRSTPTPHTKGTGPDNRRAKLAPAVSSSRRHAGTSRTPLHARGCAAAAGGGAWTRCAGGGLRGETRVAVHAENRRGWWKKPKNVGQGLDWEGGSEPPERRDRGGGPGRRGAGDLGGTVAVAAAKRQQACWTARKEKPGPR